jgi:hypothetical protein
MMEKNMKTASGHWDILTHADSISCKHRLTGTHILFVGRSTHCDIFVGQGSWSNHFNWDPFIEALTHDKQWKERGQTVDEHLLKYLRLLMAEPDFKDKVNAMAISTIEHFKSLERLKVNPKGVLTVRLGEFGGCGVKQFNFRAMQYRPKCRGPWYPLEMRKYADQDYFHYEVKEEDFEEKRWVHALGISCTDYNKIITDIFKEWCKKTDRAKANSTVTVRDDGVTVVNIGFEYPTKGERPDHLRVVK